MLNDQRDEEEESDADFRSRVHRRRRFRRHGRRAYIRSVYFLPSLATLLNAICGFAAIYVSGLEVANAGYDPLTLNLATHRFFAAAYLIFAAMVFDALDGRLARFTRHTTDFGGQLDSMADVVSFGVAPAFVALQVFKVDMMYVVHVPLALSRFIWAIGALYMSCAAVRLAKFNVSNKHGEQHHFSFLGLPSPGAAGAVCAFILMQQDVKQSGIDMNSRALLALAKVGIVLLPLLLLITGLLMVSNIRYPHLVNRYLRGKQSFARLMIGVVVALLFVIWHRYVLGIGTIAYAAWGPVSIAYLRARRKTATSPLLPNRPSPHPSPGVPGEGEMR